VYYFSLQVAYVLLQGISDRVNAPVKNVITQHVFIYRHCTHSTRSVKGKRWC